MVIVVPVYERERAGRLLQHRRRHRRRRHATSASTARTTSRTVGRLLGEVLLQARQPRLSRLPDALRARSASTSATTATSRRARARSASTAPRSSSTRRRPSPASRSTSGSSSSRRTRSRTATSSARSTASAPRRRGTSASSTARATSANPRGKILAEASRDQDELIVGRPRPRHDRRGPQHSGSSSATAGRRPTASSPSSCRERRSTPTSSPDELLAQAPRVLPSWLTLTTNRRSSSSTARCATSGTPRATSTSTSSAASSRRSRATPSTSWSRRADGAGRPDRRTPRRCTSSHPMVGARRARSSSCRRPSRPAKAFFIGPGTEADETAMLLATTARTQHRDHRAAQLVPRRLRRARVVGDAATSLGPPRSRRSSLARAAPYCYRCPLGLQYPSLRVECADDVEE